MCTSKVGTVVNSGTGAALFVLVIMLVRIVCQSVGGVGNSSVYYSTTLLELQFLIRSLL
jgi:hypothetical protein